MNPNRHLFWFLKDNARLKLNTPSEMDAYVQQVLTHGKTNDIKTLLKTIKPLQFRESFQRLSRFLPLEVRKFWEDFIGNIISSAKRTA